MTKSSRITGGSEYERLIWLHNKFQNDTFCFDDYNDKFGRTKRTLARDIEKLKVNFHAPLKCKDGRYFYTDKTFELPAILLNENELFGLAISSYVVETYKDTPLYPSLKKIMVRLGNLLSNDIKYIYLDGSIKSSKIRKFNWENIIKLAKALNQKRTVEMKYYSFTSNTVSERKVDPYYLYNWKGEFYLAGWCHKREEFRDFFIGRINNLKLTDDIFDEKLFNADQYFSDKLWGILKGGKLSKIKFKIRKDKEAWVLERFGDRLQEIKNDDSDWSTYRVESGVNDEFINWVIGWGNYLEILEPKSLRNEIIKYCKEILDLYEK